MKVGDLVIDRTAPLRYQLAIIVAKDFVTSIGTPFDYEVLYLASGQRWGADSRTLEVVKDQGLAEVSKKVYFFS